MNKQGDVTSCLMLPDLRKGIRLFKDSQASPACPSDSIFNKKIMEHWRNYTDRVKTELVGDEPVPVPLCPSQISSGLAMDRTRDSPLRSQRPTASSRSLWY